jgi:mono/diheme cytochrome c family protein
MSLIKALLLLVVAGIIAGAACVYFGVFDTAADVPHWPIVYRLMETVRQRSIAVRAKDIQVPPLDDPKLIADGAEHYSAMCTGCHLAPGMTDSEIRPGLYPQPPNLSQPLNASPAEMFWAIKHGIKMSAMPAWGTSHDDPAIWGMVAFLQKLPGMTPEQYQAMTKSSGEGEEGHHHHHHGDGDASQHAVEQK